MNAVIRPCWIVKDEWGLNTVGVYADEGSAHAVARARLTNLVKNGKWAFEKQFGEVLAGMVEQQTYYEFCVAGEVA